MVETTLFIISVILFYEKSKGNNQENEMPKINTVVPVSQPQIIQQDLQKTYYIEHIQRYNFQSQVDSPRLPIVIKSPEQSTVTKNNISRTPSNSPFKRINHFVSESQKLKQINSSDKQFQLSQTKNQKSINKFQNQQNLGQKEKFSENDSQKQSFLERTSNSQFLKDQNIQTSLSGTSFASANYKLYRNKKKRETSLSSQKGGTSLNKISRESSFSNQNRFSSQLQFKKSNVSMRTDESSQQQKSDNLNINKNSFAMNSAYNSNQSNSSPSIQKFQCQGLKLGSNSKRKFRNLFDDDEQYNSKNSQRNSINKSSSIKFQDVSRQLSQKGTPQQCDLQYRNQMAFSNKQSRLDKILDLRVSKPTVDSTVKRFIQSAQERQRVSNSSCYSRYCKQNSSNTLIEQIQLLEDLEKTNKEIQNLRQRSNQFNRQIEDEQKQQNIDMEMKKKNEQNLSRDSQYQKGLKLQEEREQKEQKYQREISHENLLHSQYLKEQYSQQEKEDIKRDCESSLVDYRYQLLQERKISLQQKENVLNRKQYFQDDRESQSQNFANEIKHRKENYQLNQLARLRGELKGNMIQKEEFEKTLESSLQVIQQFRETTQNIRNSALNY